MDAVENGQAFIVTRDGHRIGELIPLRQRRRFVPRQEFTASSRHAPPMDIEAFRADQEAALDHDRTAPMTGESPARGLLDTNIVILRKWINA